MFSSALWESDFLISDGGLIFYPLQMIFLRLTVLLLLQREAVSDFISDVKAVTSEAANRRATAAQISFNAAKKQICELHSKHEKFDLAFLAAHSTRVNNVVTSLLNSVSRYQPSQSVPGEDTPTREAAIEEYLNGIQNYICHHNAIVKRQALDVEAFVKNPHFSKQFERSFDKGILSRPAFSGNACENLQESLPAVRENDRTLLGEAQVNFLNGGHTEWTKNAVQLTLSALQIPPVSETAMVLFDCIGAESGDADGSVGSGSSEDGAVKLIGEELRAIFQDAAAIQLLAYNTKRLAELQVLSSKLTDLEKRLTNELNSFSWGEKRDQYHLKSAVSELSTLAEAQQTNVPLWKLAGYLSGRLENISLDLDRDGVSLKFGDGDSPLVCKISSEPRSFADILRCFER